MPFAEPQDIYVASLANPFVDFETIEPEERSGFGRLTWSPDRQYLLYKTAKNIFAAPLNGGPHARLFEQFKYGVTGFDRANPKGYYSVEPTDHLTTLWGKLKQ